MNQKVSIVNSSFVKDDLVDGQQQYSPLSVQEQLNRQSVNHIVYKYSKNIHKKKQVSQFKCRITENCQAIHLVVVILIICCCILLYFATQTCKGVVSQPEHYKVMSITSQQQMKLKLQNGGQQNHLTDDQKIQVQIINKNSQQLKISEIKEEKFKQIKGTDFQKQQKFSPLSTINFQKIQKQNKNLQKKQEKEDETNILNKIPQNPYGSKEYAYLQQKDIDRAKRWRLLSSTSIKISEKMINQQYTSFENKYQISKYDQLPICIVVPTYNNNARKRATRNLKSIAQQNYSNYKVLIIDDASTDGTDKVIMQYLDTDPQKFSKFKVQINQQRQYTLKNTIDAARNFCLPEQIFMVIDGDDELIGIYVLKLFSAIFQRKKIWFMYTNFITSNGLLGYSRPYHPDIIQNNSYRQYSFTVSHLRAFYTKLILNIKEEDFKDEKGNYFTAAGDMAIAIPCLQQAHTKMAYVPQITYFYDVSTGNNVSKQRLQEQRQNNLKIRAKSKYDSLQNLFD